MKFQTLALVFVALLGSVAFNPAKASAAEIDIRLSNQQNHTNVMNRDREIIQQRIRKQQQQRVTEQRTREQQQQRLTEQRTREQQQQRLAEDRTREEQQQQRLAEQRIREHHNVLMRESVNKEIVNCPKSSLNRNFCGI